MEVSKPRHRCCQHMRTWREISLERGGGDRESIEQTTQDLAMYVEKGVGRSGGSVSENVARATCQPQSSLQNFIEEIPRRGCTKVPSSAMFYDATAGAPKPTQSAF